MGYDERRDDRHEHHDHDHDHDHDRDRDYEHHHHDHDHHHDDRDHHHHGHEGGPRGPEGTEFLELEISQILMGEAQALVREVAVDLMREAARERLRQRLGERLAAVGRLAADELADDVEANLQIESSIDARRDQASTLQERLDAALRSPGRASSPPARRAGTSKKKKKTRSKRSTHG